MKTYKDLDGNEHVVARKSNLDGVLKWFHFSKDDPFQIPGRQRGFEKKRKLIEEISCLSEK